jgi:hypothetical protein
MQELNFSRQELAQLTSEKAKLEAEKKLLLAGTVNFKFGDGREVTFTVLELSEGQAYPPELEEMQLKSLEDNELFRLLRKGQQSVGEARLELVEEGQLSDNLAGLVELKGKRTGPLSRLVALNSRLNRKIRNWPFIGAFQSSTLWMLVPGILLVLVWGGGYWINALLGSKSPSPDNYLPISPSTGAPVRLLTPDAPLKISASYRLASFEKEGEPEETVTPEVTPAPTTESGVNRVGCKPGQAGGNNGPHGCFSAPSRLESRAIGLQATIARAQLLEAVGDSGSTQLKLMPPAAGSNQVLHYGAYPGEIGNLLLFGNNISLGAARNWQVGDEVVITDRKGSQYIYRILPLSPTGQAGREIDLTDPADSWVFEPAQPTAIATFILPLPVEEVSGTASITANSGSGSVLARSNPLVDDLTSSRRLAYRAVLSSYVAASAASNASRVVVPDSVWTPLPRNVPVTTAIVTSAIPEASLTSVVTTPQTVTATPDPTVTSTPTASNNGVGSDRYPGFPDSGTGGGEGSMAAKPDTSLPLVLLSLILLSSLAITGLLIHRFFRTKEAQP